MTKKNPYLSLNTATKIRIIPLTSVINSINNVKWHKHQCPSDIIIKDATIRCSVAVVAVLKMPSNNQNIFLYLYIYLYIYKYRVNSDIITTYF